jgi:hypothetical protein
MSPVNYSNPEPMKLNLAQGNQFLNYHSGQHGGSAVTSGYSAYPGAVTQGSFNDGVPLDAARQNSLIAAYRDIAGLKDQAGGRRSRKNRKNKKASRKNKKASRKNKKASRKNKKASRKNKKASRKMYRKQRGGDFVRWGGARRHVGGSMQDMENPMTVAESTKMLISPQMQAQTGLNPEWKLAENPASFNPQ